MPDPKPESWQAVADCGSIPLREGRRLKYGDKELALFNLGETYLAVDNRCPHRQGPLADGIVAGNSVFCPLHNLRIDLQTGCAMNGGEGKVDCYPVKIVDGKLYINFPKSTPGR